MSAALPTPDEMLRQTLASLEQASAALSAARDWLNSDWKPVGSELTDEQAEARTSTRTAIAAAKREIEPATYALREALR